jgi:cytochrome c-type biogenesis protein CcmE
MYIFVYLEIWKIKTILYTGILPAALKLKYTGILPAALKLKYTGILPAALKLK